jgi:hypothetical protein
MRRTASEIIRNLEMRVARLERQANTHRIAKVDLDSVGDYAMLHIGQGFWEKKRGLKTYLRTEEWSTKKDGIYIIAAVKGSVRQEMKKTGLVINVKQTKKLSLHRSFGFEIISVDHQASSERAIQDWKKSAEVFEEIDSGSETAMFMMSALAGRYTKKMQRIHAHGEDVHLPHLITHMTPDYLR